MPLSVSLMCPRVCPQSHPPKSGFSQVTPDSPSQQWARLLPGDHPNTREQPRALQGPLSRARSGQGQLPALGRRQLIAAIPQVPATSLAPELPDGHVAPEGPLLLPGILFPWK